MPVIIVKKVYDKPEETLSEENVTFIQDEDTSVAAAVARPDGKGAIDTTTVLYGTPQVLKILVKEIIEGIYKP